MSENCFSAEVWFDEPEDCFIVRLQDSDGNELSMVNFHANAGKEMAKYIRTNTTMQVLA